MKKQPCLSHHGHRPRRTCLTSGGSSRSRRSPCPYKLLGSTPQPCPNEFNSTQSKQSLINHQIKQERIKATHSLSLEAYDLYIFLPLWQQVTKQFLENA